MAILGIDYGERKVGLAKAADGTPAVPLGVIENRGRRALLAALQQRCREEGITEIVVGLPLPLRHEHEGDIPVAIRRFASALQRATGVPVHLQDERFSTREAVRLRGVAAGQPDDAVAAMLVLQTWLDRQSIKHET